MEPNTSSAVNPNALLAQFGQIKSGFKSSEFVVLLIALALLAALTFAAKLPPEVAAFVAAVAPAIYQRLRNAHKKEHNGAIGVIVETLLDHEATKIGILGGDTAPVVRVPLPPPVAPASTADLAEQPVSPAAGGLSKLPASPANSGHITLGLCLITAAFAAIACLVAGCAGFTAKLQKIQASPITQRIERDVLTIGLSFLENSIRGDSDAAWAMSYGLKTIVDEVKALPNPQAQTLIRETAVAFAGSKSPNASILAAQLAQAFGDAAPRTPEERSAAVLALAQGISNALTQPATK